MRLWKGARLYEPKLLTNCISQRLMRHPVLAKFPSRYHNIDPTLGIYIYFLQPLSPTTSPPSRMPPQTLAIDYAARGLALLMASQYFNSILNTKEGPLPLSSIHSLDWSDSPRP